MVALSSHNQGLCRSYLIHCSPSAPFGPLWGVKNTTVYLSHTPAFILMDECIQIVTELFCFHLDPMVKGNKGKILDFSIMS